MSSCHCVWHSTFLQCPPQLLTLNCVQHLTLYVFPVPPSTPIIVEKQQGVVRGADVGPFEIGGSLIVTCKVFGGTRIYWLRWWWNRTIKSDIWWIGISISLIVFHQMFLRFSMSIITDFLAGIWFHQMCFINEFLVFQFPYSTITCVWKSVCFILKSQFTILCVSLRLCFINSISGSPAPSVTWWKDGSVFDDTYELVEKQNSGANNSTVIIGGDWL